MLQGQLGSLRVETDAEVPSTFSHVLDWLSCKSLLAHRLVPYRVLPFAFAIDSYEKEFSVFVFAQEDFYVDIRFFAVFDAEVRPPPFGFFGMLVFAI